MGQPQLLRLQLGGHGVGARQGGVQAPSNCPSNTRAPVPTLLHPGGAHWIQPLPSLENLSSTQRCSRAGRMRSQSRDPCSAFLEHRLSPAAPFPLSQTVFLHGSGGIFRLILAKAVPEIAGLKAGGRSHSKAQGEIRGSQENTGIPHSGKGNSSTRGWPDPQTLTGQSSPDQTQGFPSPNPQGGSISPASTPQIPFPFRAGGPSVDPRAPGEIPGKEKLKPKKKKKKPAEKRETPNP